MPLFGLRKNGILSKLCIEELSFFLFSFYSPILHTLLSGQYGFEENRESRRPEVGTGVLILKKAMHNKRLVYVQIFIFYPAFNKIVTAFRVIINNISKAMLPVFNFYP